jgi:type III pantothenate kinase
MISLRTVSRITIDKLDLILKEYPQISSSIISSVALHDIKLNNILNNIGFFIELDHNTPVPFINKYGTPDTLGKDRIAIASAATQIYPNENTLIIDAGTSVTYDMITHKKEFLGGGISPGLNMRLESLHNFTHKLPLISLPNYDEKIALIGDSTESSILSGVVNGLTAEMQHIINQYSNSFSPLKIVISGGDYKYFEKLVKSNIFAAPNIVITGLKCILDFNEKN